MEKSVAGDVTRLGEDGVAARGVRILFKHWKRKNGHRNDHANQRRARHAIANSKMRAKFLGRISLTHLNHARRCEFIYGLVEAFAYVR